MKSLIPGVFFALFGLLMVVLRLQMAHSAIKWNYRIFGVKFSENGYKVSFFVGGLFFIVIGILALFQVIKFK